MGFESTIISETAAPADDQTVISRSTANNYQAELKSNKFKKSGNPLSIDDKNMRTKALKIYSGSLLPHRRRTLANKIAKLRGM